jgi:hypothetical protein
MYRLEDVQISSDGKEKIWTERLTMHGHTDTNRPIQKPHGETDREDEMKTYMIDSRLSFELDGEKLTPVIFGEVLRRFKARVDEVETVNFEQDPAVVVVLGPVILRQLDVEVDLAKRCQWEVCRRLSKMLNKSTTSN